MRQTDHSGDGSMANSPFESFFSFYRSLAVGIVHGLDNTATCLTLKLFPSLVYWLSFSGTNYFFSAMSLVLTIWGWMAIVTKIRGGNLANPLRQLLAVQLAAQRGVDNSPPRLTPTPLLHRKTLVFLIDRAIH